MPSTTISRYGKTTDLCLIFAVCSYDAQSLLLSHPHHSTCDTQICAGKARILKTKFPSLKKLVEHELGIAIQSGEHSSVSQVIVALDHCHSLSHYNLQVTDARATMALYRLHRKAWDKTFRNLPAPGQKSKGKKRKREESEDASALGEHVLKSKKSEAESFPGGGRRGISTGLSTVVKHHGGSAKVTFGTKGGGGGTKGSWWSTLGGVAVGKGDPKATLSL